MSSSIKNRINNDPCKTGAFVNGDYNKKICPEKPIFSNSNTQFNQSNALRLSKQILNNKKKPIIVYRSVNEYGGRSGSIGGYRGPIKNSF